MPYKRSYVKRARKRTPFRYTKKRFSNKRFKRKKFVGNTKTYVITRTVPTFPVLQTVTQTDFSLNELTDLDVSATNYHELKVTKLMVTLKPVVMKEAWFAHIPTRPTMVTYLNPFDEGTATTFSTAMNRTHPRQHSLYGMKRTWTPKMIQVIRIQKTTPGTTTDLQKRVNTWCSFLAPDVNFAYTGGPHFFIPAITPQGGVAQMEYTMDIHVTVQMRKRRT